MFKRIPLFLVLLGACFGVPAFADDNGPKGQLKTTIDAILSILTKQDIDSTTRRETITELITERFDFKKMSQQTLATNWKKTTAEQKGKFVGLFAQLLQESYMGRIEAYTDERVEFVNERIKKKRAKVNTLIVTSSVEIPINYKLTKNGEKWLVYDVVIEEVSLIRNYRNSYRNIVKKEGIDGLLVKMEEKLDEIRQVAEAS